NRLWAPVARRLASRFRCIRYDLRLYGRSESPGMEFSAIDDALGVLDALDVVLAHPDRAWALAHVAAGVTGMPVDVYSAEQGAAFEEAEASGDLDAMMRIDFDVWAPLG